MAKIEHIHAHEILDSRGNPTIETTVLLSDGTKGSACVPSGASTGVHEALELRDQDPSRYAGKGVLKAVKNVNTRIREELFGMPISFQREIDATLIALDGTKNKSALGANALLSVSLACAHAGAKHRKLPLYSYLRWVFDVPYQTYKFPYPTMNVLNGGAHAGWGVDFQEFMIVPQQRKVRERVRCGAEIFHTLGSLLKKKGYATGVGDEGGYAVSLKKNEEALKLILQAIKKAKYQPGKDVKLALDVAASEFYDKKIKSYFLKKDRKKLTSQGMQKLFASWIKKYPLISIEDGLEQDDWQGWKEMTKGLGKKVLLVGDDLFVTNFDRIQKGIKEQVANAVLIKVNQIGTLTETMDAILLAQMYGYKISVSHRSGETTDTSIVDLAVAVNADFLKCGSLSRSERLAKYNRLMEIEEELSL